MWLTLLVFSPKWVFNHRSRAAPAFSSAREMLADGLKAPSMKGANTVNSSREYANCSANCKQFWWTTFNFWIIGGIM